MSRAIDANTVDLVHAGSPRLSVVEYVCCDWVCAHLEVYPKYFEFFFFLSTVTFRNEAPCWQAPPIGRQHPGPCRHGYA